MIPRFTTPLASVLLTAAISLLLIPTPGSDLRAAEEAPPTVLVLTSRDGKTLEGTVAGLTDKKVKVRRKDGKEFEIPLERLTDDSVKAVRAAAPKPKSPEIPEKPKNPDEIPEKIMVKPGDILRIGFTVTNGKLHAPVVLKEKDESVPCFTVDFKPYKDSRTAILKQNILPAVKLRCLVRNQGQKNWYPSNIIPLQKGLPSGETWGPEIEELAFFDFEETKPMEGL